MSTLRVGVCPRLIAGADRGSVVAEFAVAMPAVLLVLAVLLSGAQVAAVQLRAQDAAADIARAWARGEGTPAGVLRGVPDAGTARADSGGLVCATVTGRPSGVAARLGATVQGTSCALAGGR